MAISHPGAVRLGLASVRLLGQRIRVPVLLPYGPGKGLIIKASDAAIERAIDALNRSPCDSSSRRNPGLQRLLLIDPVGAGEKLSGFLALGEFDSNLVCRRVWTEPEVIEDQLADVARRIEDMIQFKLADAYPTLEATTQKAGRSTTP